MRTSSKSLVHHSSARELQVIPGVGEHIASDLIDLGYRHISDIAGQNPDDMYDRLCILRGCHVDRCVLYVFRCAVYFVENTVYEPALLKWWNWKDKGNI